MLIIFMNEIDIDSVFFFKKKVFIMCQLRVTYDKPLILTMWLIESDDRGALEKYRFYAPS
jgi:hypothetical protein